MDPKRLQVAYDLMEKWTVGPNAPVPGGAILVGRHGKVIAPRFFGRQGPEADAGPIRRDAMFYMASVTKPVIYIGAMILVERGLLNLSDRVSRYVPEFTGGGKDDVQVIHLFTHTSGLPDELTNNADLRRQHAPLKAFIAGSIKADLLFKPGTRQSYASAGTLIVAEIIQRLSGKSIREFVHREIIDPLGLKSTGLGSQGLVRERIVRATVPDYQVGTDFGWNSTYWQEFGSPTGGLFSTPEDYAVVCALMMGGGRWGGVKLLSPATVRMMTSNRLDDLPDLPEAVRRTQPWGLGWRLNHLGMADSWGDLLDRQVFGHTGSSGNLVWMDPRTQGFCILLTNYLRARAPWRLVHLSNAIAAAFE
ncbi:Beta-lactamase class C [Fimbriiglobus ruber]|uniref:Beta-lactamase class C n=2 Tax=Fimbriiglobus ruber TaxID=1908690 RepID=A0A225DAV8_9BACT|nr:Beta-lactamase class C [Fimbriiglobus ruber]